MIARLLPIPWCLITRSRCETIRGRLFNNALIGLVGIVWVLRWLSRWIESEGLLLLLLVLVELWLWTSFLILVQLMRIWCLL